ncbi:MAG: selenocysteine-specific translation elongation factor [Spirochaetes bacterium]|nr:MAG: selenocysteine-specific translation elongation factor [Spirochaetota bacterium]
MYIVGTSGHIDHGKTSLIRALTGIDCDRLPEEKAREMTIDIGFAQIEYPKFGTVSVIDVPGHERFIRNMVAGAWGVDLAILVVAVDDGWMPQTEDHFRVLSLLGVERMVVALNKIDAADPEMIAFVQAEVEEKLAGTRYAGSDIVKVSSKTCEGVADLKEVILKNLRKLPRAANADRPYLYVDRVFASKGFGTVVTGTLKNGVFRENDELTLLPGARPVRVKKIESHYHEMQEGVPSQRTALNLTGVSTEEVGRGHVVVRQNFFAESGEILARIELLEKRRAVKNNMGIEVLIGTTTVKGRLILADAPPEGAGVFPARVKFDEPWYFYPGQPFILTNPGGFRIIGGGSVVLTGAGDASDRKRVKGLLPLLGAFSREETAYFIIAAARSMPRAAFLRMFPDSEKHLATLADTLIASGKVLALDGLLVDAVFAEEALAAIVQAVGATVGPNLQEIAGRVRIGEEICRALMPRVMERHSMVEKDGRYFAGDAITADTLSPERTRALEQARARGAEGVELDRLPAEAEKKQVRELVRLGFLVSLDGNIVLHRAVYDELKGRVMKLFEGRDKITIPEAKEATGFSRKYIIPFLNRMETEGLLKRIGDFRMKA